MGIFDFLKRDKTANKGVPPIENYGTLSEARIYFEKLISSYTSDFKVDTPAQILNAYRAIPQLNTLINNSADAFIRADKILYNISSDGTKTIDTDSQLYKVLENPHVLQSKNEFWKTLYINWSLFGRQHTYKRVLPGYKELKNLLVLPSSDVEAVLKKDPEYLNANKISDIIDYYIVDKGNGKANKITDVSKVWTLRDSSLSTKNDGFMTNENPLKAYEKTLGTLRIIADVKNELLANHGALGIISPNQNKDETGGSQPWTVKQKEDVQKTYREYGLTKGKNKLVITNQDIKFTSISLKIAELLLTEFETKASEVLANGKNYPVVLLSGLKQYKNKDAGTEDLYENKIIPESDIIIESFKSEFKLLENNQDFVFDFSKIAALQADQKKETERKKIETNIISLVNKDVQQGITDRQTAVNRLIDIGRAKEDAERLISPVTKPQT